MHARSDTVVRSTPRILRRPVPSIAISAEVVERLRGLESATSLAILSAGLLAMVGLAATMRSTSEVATMAAFVAVCAVVLATSLLVRGRVAVVGAVAAIATITAFSAATLEVTPTVVWLFAFVVPVVGLVHGTRLGALAGALSAPALLFLALRGFG
jgi:ribose/xylose/arabinose/galactoside ABC-type transport system permease subunit